MSTTGAGASPVERGVMALAERLALLADAYRDDYLGREIDSGLLQRVQWYCADKPDPESIGAGEMGTVCVTWSAGDETLSCEFGRSGGAVWAGSKGDGRRWAAGYPLPSEWACLRPNVM
jgi:hypothetical protein